MIMLLVLELVEAAGLELGEGEEEEVMKEGETD
jgi:hypothetical protein